MNQLAQKFILFSLGFYLFLRLSPFYFFSFIQINFPISLIAEIVISVLVAGFAFYKIYEEDYDIPSFLLTLAIFLAPVINSVYTQNFKLVNEESFTIKYTGTNVSYSVTAFLFLIPAFIVLINYKKFHLYRSRIFRKTTDKFYYILLLMFLGAQIYLLSIFDTKIQVQIPISQQDIKIKVIPSNTKDMTK
jgi:hypothetical protein